MDLKIKEKRKNPGAWGKNYEIIASTQNESDDLSTHMSSENCDLHIGGHTGIMISHLFKSK